MQLSIIVPTYNENKNIIPLVKSLQDSVRVNNYEIIFIDDNSPDHTYETIKSISEKRNPSLYPMKTNNSVIPLS